MGTDGRARCAQAPCRSRAARWWNLAIAIGTLLSATIWSFADTAYVGFLLGSMVIVAFGMLDDRNNLDFA